MGLDGTTKRCERFLHIVVVAVDVCKGRDLGCGLGLSEQIQGQFRWLEKVAPQREWELVVDARQDGDEMCLECLNCSFGLVLPVITGGNEFIFHAIVSYCFFECLGCFVVKDVFFQAEACRAHSADDSLVSRRYLTFCSVLHGLVEDVVVIEVNCHHYVSVASLGHEGKTAGLIGVYGFSQVRYLAKDVLVPSNGGWR